MKTVFNNSMVAHVWANQLQEHGRNSDGSLYFEGDTIYSYGSHFPAAKIYEEQKTILINCETYSPTTSQHLGDIWQAIDRGKYRVFRVPDVLDPGSSENLDYFNECFASSFNSIFKVTKPCQYLIVELKETVSKYNEFKKIFGLDWETIELDAVFEDYLEDVLELRKVKDKEEVERKEKREKKRQLARIEEIRSIAYGDGNPQNMLREIKNLVEIEGDKTEHLERMKYLRSVVVDDLLETVNDKDQDTDDRIDALLSVKSYDRSTFLGMADELKELYALEIEEFRAGHTDRLYQEHEFDLLRIKGAVVQTSGYADVPLTHALMLLKKVRDNTAKPGDRCGHFTLDYIKEGVVKVGCHKIEISEAEHVLGPVLDVFEELKGSEASCGQVAEHLFEKGVRLDSESIVTIGNAL